MYKNYFFIFLIFLFHILTQEFSPVQPLKDVSLTTVNGNENINKRLNELLNNYDTSSTDLKYQLEQGRLSILNNNISCVFYVCGVN